MKNRVKTIALLGALSAMLIGIGAAIGPQALVAFTIVAMLVNLGMYFFSDRLVLKLHGAREVSEADAPMLHAIVHELRARAGLPKPRVCLMPSMQPNAFATGRNPHNAVVAVTQGIVQISADVQQPATASLFIVNPLSGVGGMARLFSTHPPSRERVRRLRARRYGREGIAA